MGSQAVKPRVVCAECGKPQHHAVHSPTEWQHDFVKPVVEKKRKPLAPHSPRMQQYYDEVRIPAVAAMQGKPCEAGLEGCTRFAVDIHEIVSRRQAGNLPLAVELGTMNLCRRCHDWITNHPREARNLGYSLSRKDIRDGEA